MSKLEVKFDDNNKAMFESDCDMVQLSIAIASIEGYIASQTGLSQDDIRAMVDECKTSLKVSSISSETEVII